MDLAVLSSRKRLPLVLYGALFLFGITGLSFQILFFEPATKTPNEISTLLRFVWIAFISVSLVQFLDTLVVNKDVTLFERIYKSSAASFILQDGNADLTSYRYQYYVTISGGEEPKSWINFSRFDWFQIGSNGPVVCESRAEDLERNGKNYPSVIVELNGLVVVLRDAPDEITMTNIFFKNPSGHVLAGLQFHTAWNGEQCVNATLLSKKPLFEISRYSEIQEMDLLDKFDGVWRSEFHKHNKIA